MTSNIWMLCFVVWIACGMENCVICLDSMVYGQAIAKPSNCIHKFHRECIESWRVQNSDCPCCRQKIEALVNILRSPADYRINYGNVNPQQHDGEHAVQVRDIMTQVDFNEENRQENQLPLRPGEAIQQNRFQLILQLFHEPEILHETFKFSSLWLVVQISIILARYLVPSWSLSVFSWAQAVNMLPLIPVFISTCHSERKKLLMIASILTAISGTLVYHSVFSFILSGADLFTAISWFWLLAILTKIIHCTFHTYRQMFYDRSLECGWRHYLWWSLVEIEILVGKFLVPAWVNWFLWMQFFQVVSLILNVSSQFSPPEVEARKNFRSACGITIFTSILSYHSITGFALYSYPELLLATIWPYVYLTTWVSVPRYEVDLLSPNFWRGHAFRFFVWLFVEAGIIMARIYVPNWIDWFAFMQGFHVIALLWLPFDLDKFSFFTTLVVLLSYHSVMTFLFSGWVLFHAIFWPWFSLMYLTCICCCAHDVLP